jgi:2-keto-3-deoxy-L-rhamnonate aldolase RhmA/quercetin dioxygenase-like cupin family protein
MKTNAIQALRRRLALDLPVFGLWVTLEAPAVTEMAVALGVDWVVIDTEHGHLDWKEVVEHLRATVRSDTVALVRIPELNGAAIKRALDLGADGVVVPWVESADQLREAVRLARYPVEGARGIGAERATAWGQCLVEHTAEANDHVLVVPIIETIRTAPAVPEMAAVSGVELYFFGPADFSASAGHRGQWEGPGVARAILDARDVIRRAGRHCGVLSTGIDNLHERLRQGFRMVGLGQDTGLLLRSLRATLASVGCDRPLRTSLTPTGDSLPLARLERPPESFRPDRVEVMNRVDGSPVAAIASGVTFTALVGGHNGARNLTTGQVAFAPGAGLAYHTHPFGEAITLLRGRLVVEVEGRVYELEPLDNIVIPRETAHAARNPSPNEEVCRASSGSRGSAPRRAVRPDRARRSSTSSIATWCRASR